MAKSTAEIEQEARRLFAAGQPDAALALMEQLAAASPDDARLRFLLGTIYIQLGNRERAAVHLRVAAAGAPDDADVQTDIATYLAAAGCDREAHVLFQRAATSTRDFGHLMNYAISCLTVGDLATGEQIAGEAVGLEPTSADAVSVLAACTRDPRRVEALVQQTRALLARHPPPPPMVEIIEERLRRAGAR